ncbi:restriction endonuclease [Myroides pelagicus]|uniref:McrC family protein n=1 Tax=Myroides pelagicus TaxID=270914 RepID=UPI002DBD1D19|nr:restriction endonuclease [Myroides pelagicus]MEC4114068.1 restriction endonuclease [Myroides pelagicus]
MSKQTITVFEHQKLLIGDDVFTTQHHKRLCDFYGTTGVPFYSLIHKGVKFNQYVGVLQLGDLTIEILPKVENNEQRKDIWRRLLIDMIWRVSSFKTHHPTASKLSIKPNAILDVYIAMYLQGIRQLIRQGLIKRYRSQEGNTVALKGNLIFGKHIQQNLVHQERFYTRHSVYDVDHELHQVLYRALLLVKRINTNVELDSEINQLQFAFPEQTNIKITKGTFDKIVLNRKTAPYGTTLEIAQLLLLNYHPDIRGGNNEVLALLFDMNVLWERFVFVTIHKYLKGTHKVREQVKKEFWQSQTEGYRSVNIYADIVITDNSDSTKVFIFDTKWKNLEGKPYPSVEDLRQMYVYHQFYNASRVALVYPSQEAKDHKGHYLKGREGDVCHLIHLGVKDTIKNFEEQIKSTTEEWIK